MNRERLFRGELHCTVCNQEGKATKSSCWNLVRQEDGTYIAFCHKHQPKNIYHDPNLSMVQTSLAFPWEDVVKLTLHKPSTELNNYKGDIVTVEMRDVPNRELMRTHSIEICQALMMIAGRHCVVHNYGERGEQNHCFVDPNYRHENPPACTIRDKYWGRDQIKKFQDVCRLMARIHEWELVDETKNVLDRIIDAVDNSSSPEL